MNSFSACIAKNEEYSVPCSPSSSNSSPTVPGDERGGVGQSTAPGISQSNTARGSNASSSTSAATSTSAQYSHHHRGSSQTRGSIGPSAAPSHHLSGATAAVFFPAYHNMDQNMEGSHYYHPTGMMVPPPPPPPPPTAPTVKKEKSPSLTIDRAAFLLLRVKKAFKRKRQQRKDKQ